MTAYAERFRDRIRVYFPYDAQAISALKAVQAGAGKDEAGWYRTLPLSMDSCRIIREVFGERLEIGPELWLWASAETKLEREFAERASCLSGWPLEVIPQRYPELARAVTEVRPYQSGAIAAAALGRVAIIADTPGLGKTTEAIGAVVEANVPGPFLVFAPQTALDVVWERELRRWLPDARVYALLGARAKREGLLREAFSGDTSNLWIIVNIEMVRTRIFWVCPTCEMRFRANDRPRGETIICGHEPEKARVELEHDYPELFRPEWGALIADESQRALIKSTGRQTQTRDGAVNLSVAPRGVALALSGTPMRGAAERIWGTLNWLLPKQYSSRWRFLKTFWKVTASGYGDSLEIGGFQDDREEMFNKSLAGIMIRRTKREVSPEVPDKVYCGASLYPDRDPDQVRNPVAWWLPMTPKQAKACEDIRRIGAAKVKDGTLNAVGALGELTRLKQLSTCFGRMDGDQFIPTLPSNKFDWLEQFLCEMSIIDAEDKPEGKVVIVSQFTEILALFAHELDAKYRMPYRSITGKVTGKRRTAAIDEFNDPDSGVNVMFLNTTAGGVAVTLDAADDMVLLDETHVWDDQEQVEDRINNRNPERRIAPRRYHYLKSLGSVEEAIAATNAATELGSKRHLDGRRGIEFVRAVYREMGEKS